MGLCQQCFDKQSEEQQDQDESSFILAEIGKENFTVEKVIGRGAFGKVLMVRKKDTGEIYAMKVLKKSQIFKKKQQKHIEWERKILESNKCPFLVNLKYAFQTPDKLYMVMEFCQGGELFFHLRKQGRFSEKKAKFYVAQIVLALEYLHSQNVIYRDLKPENCLLDSNGNIKLTDFGLSKLGLEEGEKAYTFCGTPEYLAPEVIKNKGYTKAVDWWSTGALLYEMLSGIPPFYDKNRKQMFSNIVNKPVKLKSYFSTEAADLIKQLLTIDPSTRLQDSTQIKQHQFFQTIDWEKLQKRELQPPFVPQFKSQTDLRLFDKMFTDERPVDSTIQDQSWQNQDKGEHIYPGFTYLDKEHLNQQKNYGSIDGVEAKEVHNQQIVECIEEEESSKFCKF